MLVTDPPVRSHGDRGSAMVSVMITMVVLSVLALAGAAIVMSTTRNVAGNSLSSQSRASADAGLSAAVAAFKRGNGCPGTNPSASGTTNYTTTCRLIAADSQVRFTAIGTDSSGHHTTKVEAVYEYEATTSGGAADGAIVSGDPTMNVSSISISADANDGHIILNLGNFDCNNTMEMEGNLIVRNGNISLSNNCKIHGSVYASGKVTISNSGVVVDGDVVALGSEVMINAGRVKGNVYSAGVVNMPSNATVEGAVTSAGSGNSSFYMAKVGSITAAGTIKLQDSTVSGSVSSAKAGGSNEIAPTATIGGNLTLAGTISTWSGGPKVAGITLTNASGVVTPTVTAPLPLQPEGFKWIDYDFDPAEWEDLGYTVIAAPGCNYQGNTALINAINNLTEPTVINALGCSTLHLYDVTFNIKTDLLLVANKFESAQRLKINSADGAKHSFSMVTPDNNPNHAPTCGAGQGVLKIDDVVMGDHITGIAYSPCTVAFGQSGGYPSRWNGQIYAGSASWGGNSVPGMKLNYTSVELPGFVVAGSDPAGSTGKQLKELVRRRDVT